MTSGEKNYLSLRGLQLFKELCDEAHEKGLQEALVKTLEEVKVLIDNKLKELDVGVKVIKASDGITAKTDKDGAVTISANIVAGPGTKIETVKESNAIKISAEYTTLPKYYGTGAIEVAQHENEVDFEIGLKENSISNEFLKEVNVNKLVQDPDELLMLDGGNALNNKIKQVRR